MERRAGRALRNAEGNAGARTLTQKKRKKTGNERDESDEEHDGAAVGGTVVCSTSSDRNRALSSDAATRADSRKGLALS